MYKDGKNEAWGRKAIVGDVISLTVDRDGTLTYYINGDLQKHPVPYPSLASRERKFRFSVVLSTLHDEVEVVSNPDLT